MALFIDAQETGGRDRRRTRPVMVGAGRLVPGRWTAAAYTCLMVALYVAEPPTRRGRPVFRRPLPVLLRSDQTAVTDGAR
jgi:hypothetical protein